MIKGYKTEIKLTPEQVQAVNKTLGVHRFVYNFYISHNKEIYENEKKYISGMNFYKWLINEFIPGNPDYSWITEASIKSVKQSIMNADEAFRDYVEGKSEFPNFKKKGRPDVKLCFVEKDKKTVITYEGDRIKIPVLGWVKLTEKDVMPADRTIDKGTITCQSGRFYLSVFFKDTETKRHGPIKLVINKFKEKLSMDKDPHHKMYGISDNIIKNDNKITRSRPSYINIEDLNISKNDK